MKRYGVTDKDLFSDAVGFHLAYIGDQNSDYRLFVQIAHKFHKGTDKVRIVDIRNAPKSHKEAWAKAGLGPKNSNAGLYCTKAEFMEIVSLFEVYQEDMHRQEDVFFYAYLDKNDLLLDSDGNDKELTEEEISRAIRAALIADGIEKKTVYKEIENI